MNATQLRELIVRPALQLVNLHSESAENLVMGTAAVESRLEYVKQIGGPALGLWQMEPATHDDIWDRWLTYRSNFMQVMLAAIGCEGFPAAERMIWDLRYAAIMCRIHYRRRPEALPDKDDVWGMAGYWKSHYNTTAGRGTVEKFVDSYRLVQ